MNDLFKNLVEQLRKTSGGTKLIALMGGASFLSIIALVALVSKKSDLSAMVFVDMDASQTSKIATALGTAQIDFFISPSAPHFIQVDEDDVNRARAAAYSSGALASEPIGVQTESGMGSVFASADQRGQVVDKLKEEEIELLLIALDFVNKASVRISQPERAAIGGRNAKPMSVATIVTVAAPPNAQQKNALASLVTNATGVDQRFVTITDHNGNRLFDGSEQVDEMLFNADQMNFSFDYDQRTSSKANEELAKIYGPNMASVMVKSEWDFEKRVERTESSGGEVILSSTKNESSRAGRASVGGTPGLGGNSSAAEPKPETSKQESTTNRPLLTRSDSVNSQPRIKQLTVALTLHSSLEGKRDELNEAVKGLVGFSAARSDTFSSVVHDLYTEPVDPDAVVSAPEPTSAPNPMLETLLRRGVELLTASIFILMLMKSLKASNKKPVLAQSANAPEQELDLELLARANVDELLRTDPERVGEVLSAWARGEKMTGAK